MKKITRIAALLAAGALLFGAVGCSDDDDSSSSDVAVTGVSISPSSNVSVAIDKTKVFTATVTPENATNKTVTWEISEGGDFAEVEDNKDGTATVTGKKEGKVKLTVKTEDGGRTADVKFNVYDPDNLVPVTGVSLDKTEATVKVGEEVTLKATVVPETADNRNVTWSSSDNGVATVADGVVTGVTAGPATITVKTEDGDYKATCVVTVEEAVIEPDDDDKKEENPSNPNAATISFDANEDEGSRFVKPTVDGVFSDVKEEFGAYNIGSFWTIFTSTDESITSAKFTVSSVDTAKLAGYDVDSDKKVNMTGWLLTCSSTDADNGLTAPTKGTEVASTTYTFTLAKKAKVTASQVAFNGQTGNVNGQISILDSSKAVKGTATGESATKEDNDAAITDAVTLDAGTYTLKFAWVTSKDKAQIKKWNCGVEKFTLTATPLE